MWNVEPTLLGPVLPQPTPKPAKKAMWMPMGITLEPLDDKRVDLFRDLQAGFDFREVGQQFTKGLAGLTNFNLCCTRFNTRGRQDPNELAKDLFAKETPPASPTIRHEAPNAFVPVTTELASRTREQVFASQGISPNPHTIHRVRYNTVAAGRTRSQPHPARPMAPSPELGESGGNAPASDLSV